MRSQAIPSTAVYVLAGLGLLVALGWVAGENVDAQAQASRKPPSESALLRVVGRLLSSPSTLRALGPTERQ